MEETKGEVKTRIILNRLKWDLLHEKENLSASFPRRRQTSMAPPHTITSNIHLKKEKTDVLAHTLLENPSSKK